MSFSGYFNFKNISFKFLHSCERKKYAFLLFLIYSFDNDDMKSSKRHVILLSLIFLLKRENVIGKKKRIYQ